MRVLQKHWVKMWLFLKSSLFHFETKLTVDLTKEKTIYAFKGSPDHLNESVMFARGRLGAVHYSTGPFGREDIWDQTVWVPRRAG